jgi:hypothetical protein
MTLFNKDLVIDGNNTLHIIAIVWPGFNDDLAGLAG